jgi:DNA-binding IclR family transcriptional regulator
VAGRRKRGWSGHAALAQELLSDDPANIIDVLRRQSSPAPLTLLKDRPMKSTEIAKTTAAKTATMSERMRRLEKGGFVARDADGAWSATAAS